MARIQFVDILDAPVVKAGTDVIEPPPVKTKGHARKTKSVTEIRAKPVTKMPAKAESVTKTPAKEVSVTQSAKRKGGRPKAAAVLTQAEKQRAYRERRKAKPVA